MFNLKKLLNFRSISGVNVTNYSLFILDILLLKPVHTRCLLMFLMSILGLVFTSILNVDASPVLSPPPPLSLTQHCQHLDSFSELYPQLQDQLTSFLIPSNHHPSSLILPTKTPFLLSLWASWCDPCIKEVPRLFKWSQQTKIPIYWINVNPKMLDHTLFLFNLIKSSDPSSLSSKSSIYNALYSFFLPLKHRSLFLKTFLLSDGFLPIHLWVFPELKPTRSRNTPHQKIKHQKIKHQIEWKACRLEGQLLPFLSP